MQSTVKPYCLPAFCHNFCEAGKLATIKGANFDITHFQLDCNNALHVRLKTNKVQDATLNAIHEVNKLMCSKCCALNTTISLFQDLSFLT